MVWSNFNRNAPGDLPDYPGMYHSPTQGGGFQNPFAGAGGWLGAPAYEGAPDQGLLAGQQSGAPKTSRLQAISDLLTGAASGYMQGLNSGVRGSQWGMAGIGAANALKESKEAEYQKQRQEIMDRVAYLNATKKTGNKSQIVPPGAVVLDEKGNPIYSNPKEATKKEPTGDLALAAALADPNTDPETRKYLEGIYRDKIRPPAGPQPPQPPAELALVKALADPKTPPEQRALLQRMFDYKTTRPEAKPPADVAMAQILDDPNTDPEVKANLQKLWDKRTAPAAAPKEAAAPEVIRTAEHLFPGDTAKQNEWIMAQKAKPAPHVSADVDLAQRLADPNTPPEVKATLNRILEDKVRPPNAPQPPRPIAAPEIQRTAEFLFPGDTDAQRAWVTAQKTKTENVTYLRQEDGSFVPVPVRVPGQTPPEIAARPKPAVLGPTEIKLKEEAENSLASGEQTVSIIKRLQELNPEVPGGPGTGITKYASMLSNPEQFAKTQELSNLATQQALGVLKSTFGAQPTEGERQILLDVSGSVEQPPEVRKKIYDRAMEAVAARQDMTRKRYKEITEGSYGRPQTPDVRTWNPTTRKLE